VADLPEDINICYLAGQFAAAVIDSFDPGSRPDSVPYAGLNVKVRALPKDLPVTHRASDQEFILADIDTFTDTQGRITDGQGNPWIAFVAPSPSLSPGSAAPGEPWKVTVTVSGAGFTQRSKTFVPLPSTSANPLQWTDIIEVAPSTPAELEALQQVLAEVAAGRAGAEAARDDAEAAAASIAPGVAGGVAQLDGAAKVPDTQLPDYVSPTSLAAVSGAALVAPGALYGFLGDSITNGSAATNFSYSYPAEAVAMVGGLVARPDSIEAGVPGNTSAQMLARLPGLLAMGVEALVLLAGTNDAGSVPLATFKANITEIVTTSKTAGVPVVMCTVPPLGSTHTAASHARVAAYNDWIRRAAPAFGCELADVYSTLVDTTTGYLTAAYDTDGTHPNDEGHIRIALEVASAMRRAAGLTPTSKIGLIRTKAAGNLITDPLAATGATAPSGWFEWPGGTGTAPTYSLVTDTSGVLPAGRWAQMDFNATAGGVRRQASHGMAVTAGDVLLVTLHVQVEDLTGTWVSDVRAGTALVGFNLINSNTGAGIGQGMLLRNPGLAMPDAPTVRNIGPIAYRFVVPAGATNVTLWCSAALPTGKRVKFRFGAIGVLNLTARGDATEYNWGSAMINI
jgi:lysophospholipase L1-like esterase